MDVSQLSAQLDGFITCVIALFCTTRAALESGYTKQVIDHLETSAMAWPDSGAVRHMHPCTQADLEWAFGHMQSFVKLLLFEVDAEFPSSGLSQSFRVLDVIDVIDDSRFAANATTKNVFKRLAQVFDVGFDDLMSKFLRVRSRAILEAKKTPRNPIASAAVLRFFRQQNLCRRE